MKNLMKKVEKYSWILLLLAYIIGIILYGYLTSKMTSICILPEDEEIYINMARSFFYEGIFSLGYGLINYNCVIYSIVISLAYCFYSPGNIVTLIRLLGVILIVSSIFPIYVLSLKVLKSKIKAIGIAIFGLIIPEIGLSQYVLQEVLLYPVFLWTIYLIYIKFKGKKSNILDVSIIIMLALMFFIKSYAISFGIAYFVTVLVIHIKKVNGVWVNNKKELVKILIGIIIFIAICGLLYLGIYAINDFQEGTNHYSSQIASIFPITFNTIISFIYGNIYYCILFLFCTGMLPVLVPILNVNKYKETDRKFIIFLSICVIVTILEIVTVVFIPEESGRIYPIKFCYRYQFVFMIPFLIMFMKIKKDDIDISNILIGIYGVVFIYMILYYMEQGYMGTSIDAGILASMQYNSTSNKNTLIIITFSLISLFILQSSKKRNIKVVYMVVAIIVLVIYTPRYWACNLWSSNELQEGIKLKPELVKVAENIENEGYTKVYLLNDGIRENHQVRVIGSMLNVEYKALDYFEEEEIKNEKICLILPKEFYCKVTGADKIDIGTEYVDIYVSDRVYNTLKINYQ